MRFVDLFQLLETHGDPIVQSRFTESQLIPDDVSDRVVDLSIQITVEERGPNLWQKTLDVSENTTSSIY